MERMDTCDAMDGKDSSTSDLCPMIETVARMVWCFTVEIRLLLQSAIAKLKALSRMEICRLRML